MAHFSKATLIVVMAGAAYAQVLAGSADASTASAASVTATQTATAQEDATAFSILQDVSSPQVLAASAAASSASPVLNANPSVVSIFFPGADPLPYVGSIIGSANGAQTLAISCGPGVDDNTCGFPSSVTVIAGPSTAYVSVSNQDATFIYDCKISASTKAICAETFNGDVAYIATSSKSGGPSGSTSSMVTETLGSSDITWMPITITVPGGTASTKAAATTGPAASSAASAAGNASWSNLNGSGSIGSSPAASTGNSASTPVQASSQTTNSVPSAAATTASYTSTTAASVSMATWTGAAAKVGAIGNVAAGVLALAGMIW